MNINIEYFETAFGELILGSYGDQLCLCDWRYRKMRNTIDERIRKGLNANYIEANSEINRIAKTQLNEYFNQERKEFDIPLLTVGSDFQKSVWLELQQIPYGITETYLGLSIKMNNEKAIRAVSAANGANAISIFIPCHRVIGSKNELTGYAGGIPVKKKLLRLENVDLNHGQTNLFG